MIIAKANPDCCTFSREQHRSQTAFRSPDRRGGRRRSTEWAYKLPSSKYLQLGLRSQLLVGRQRRPSPKNSSIFLSKKSGAKSTKQNRKMSSQDSKLLATAVGAAAAGAALAVMAMKLTEEKQTAPDHHRITRKSVLMNDDSYVAPTLKRQDSGNLLFPHNHEEKMRRRIATRYQIEDENSAPRESVTVRVPATSANVGPGCKFDIPDAGLGFQNILF